jgi:hypothetical protein
MFGLKVTFSKEECKQSFKKVTGYIDDKVDKMVTSSQAKKKAEAEHSIREKELELEILKLKLEIEKTKSNKINK